jgi:hypothetical protein
VYGLLSATYQQNNGDVEHESAETVEEKGEQANVVDVIHGDLGNLPDQGNNSVHDSADRSEVVDRDKRVHLEVGGAKQTLDHGKTESLEDDTTNLVQDSDQDEVNLANGGNDDTDDDGRDVEELLQVGLGDTKKPAGDKHSDGRGGLEHLDEGDREVEVRQVAADERQREEEANGDNSAQVDAAGHLDVLAAIKQRGEASHELCHNGREDLVVGRKDDGIACCRLWLATRSEDALFGSGEKHTEVQRIEKPFVEEND